MKLDDVLDELVDAARQELPDPERTDRIGRAVQAATVVAGASIGASSAQAVASGAQLAPSTLTATSAGATSATTTVATNGAIVAASKLATGSVFATATKVMVLAGLAVGGTTAVMTTLPVATPEVDQAAANDETGSTLSPLHHALATPALNADGSKSGDASEIELAPAAVEAPAARPTSTNSQTSATRRPPSQSRQLAALLSARRLIHRNPGRALAILNAMGTPQPSLAEEFSAIRLRALVAAGREQDAERARTDLLQRFPQSPYASEAD